MNRDDVKPFVHPGVPQGALSPASAYAAGVAARRGGPIKDNTPVAGGRAPSIPRLDGAPVQGSGFTMEQHAQAERGGRAAVTQGPQLAAIDLLPDAAKADPEFRPGQGSMLAMNQPHLAAKYGVIRNGKPIAPQQLVPPPPPGTPLLRPETQRGLEQLAAFAKAQTNPLPVEQAPASEGATAAARIGNIPGDVSEQPLSDEDRKAIKESVSQMDEFQFDSWRQAMMKDLINNEEQKKIVEERMKPLDVEDLILNMEIIQRVPIIPNKFEPSFKTTSGETDLAIKRLIMEDTRSLEVSDRYYLDKFALMALCAALHAINNKPFPTYQDSNGNFDDTAFRKKLDSVLRLPLHMLASLGVHAFWFDQRVRSLFKAESLGNG